MGYLVGVDIGGTFTDCAVLGADGEITVGKAPTTPANPAIGFFESIDVAARRLGLSTEGLLGQTDRLAHGTTVAINAVVTRTGAKVGLLATKGHGDTMFIMDGAGRVTGVSPSEIVHFPSSRKPRPIVEHDFVEEVTERTDFAGDVIVPLNEDEVVAAVDRLVAAGVESIAVAYLWSVARPDHELRTAELIRKRHPRLEISLSHTVAPKVGEYPRTATTVFNAYVAPLMTEYTREIEQGAAERGYAHKVLFMQCAGGVVSGEQARSLPVQTLQSGPVAGVTGSAFFAEASGRRNVITTDMGGTTHDVSVISEGRPLVGEEMIVDQYLLTLRTVDVQSIGAGGGSIASVDELTGTLRVGPQSAGADPGPACYGRGGTLPTVTDADLVLGILDPDYFLGGRLKLDRDRAAEAISAVAEPLGLSVEACAAGIVQVVDARMADLILSMTVQQGLDPRRFTVYAFGGGGGSHAGLYTQGLGISEFIVPLADAASVWSALGVATADVVYEFARPLFMTAPFEAEAVASGFNALERQARAVFERDQPVVEEWRLERLASCKYGAQIFEVDTEVPSGKLDDAAMATVVQNFETTYARKFGADAGYREAGVLITKLGLRVTGVSRKPAIGGREVELKDAPEAALKAHRDVYWHELGAFEQTRVWVGEQLGPGDSLSGPAIVEFVDTTLVVRPGGSLTIDAFGNARVRTTRAVAAPTPAALA